MLSMLGPKIHSVMAKEREVWLKAGRFEIRVQFIHQLLYSLTTAT